MRLDKFLKVSRLIKRRTVAKEACDKGVILINGKTAKAGDVVNPKDIIEINMGNKPIKVEILDVKEHVSKEEANEMYKLI
ncbi:MAG: RNA-binding S4 domain-containing protein [Thermoanaerobacteraceae bacterium]